MHSLINSQKAISSFDGSKIGESNVFTFIEAFFQVLYAKPKLFSSLLGLWLTLFQGSTKDIIKTAFSTVIFSGNDWNVLHWIFLRHMFNAGIYNIEEIVENTKKISAIDINGLNAPIGADFRLIFVTLPVIFFYNEMKTNYNREFSSFLERIKFTKDNSPMIKRSQPSDNLPLIIRCYSYDLARNAEIVFDFNNALEIFYPGHFQK